MSAQIGDQRTQGDSQLFLALTMYLLGDFEGSIPAMLEVAGRDRQSNNVERQIWAMTGACAGLNQLGRLDEIEAHLTTLDSLMSDTTGRIARMLYHAVRLHLYLKRDDLNNAVAEADIAAGYIIQSRINNFGVIEAYYGVGEAYLRHWESLRGQPRAGAAEQKAQHWVNKVMAAFASAYPMTLARLSLYRGWSEWLSGNHEAAEQSWNESLTLAKRNKTPYDRGLTHYALGRHLTVNDPRRRENLEQAREIFTTLKASIDLARVEAALKENSRTA
jgi:hypothetical protein